MIKAFARWANHVLQQRGLAIHDIDHDLRNGSVLMSLVEVCKTSLLSSFNNDIRFIMVRLCL